MALLKKNNIGDRPNSFVSQSGSGIKQEYVGKLDRDTGIIKLVPSKKKDLYAEIQSWKDSCDINKIVERYRSGEIDILNQVQGVYGDFSVAPSDLASAYAMSRDAEMQFDRLPSDVKERFNNNVYVWLSTAGSDDWLNNMSVGKVVQNVQDSVTDKEGGNKE